MYIGSIKEGVLNSALVERVKGLGETFKAEDTFECVLKYQEGLNQTDKNVEEQEGISGMKEQNA